MNSTKYLLENYRQRIIDDELAIKILADLYLNLPKSENEIAKDFPKKNIKAKLAELFKTSLIERNFDDLWSITYLGKLIIQKLDIASLSIDYQLKELDLDKVDYYFLLSCIQSQAFLDENYYNSVSAYIKTLKGLIKPFKQTNTEQNNLLKESLYIYIVGLDENLNKLGVDSYPDFILSNLNNSKLKNIRTIQSIIKKNIGELQDSCIMSKKFIQESNRFISNVDFSSFYKNIWSSESVKRTTFLRFLNPLVNKEIDNDFCVIYKYNNRLSHLLGMVDSFSDEFYQLEKNLNTKLKIEKYINKDYDEVVNSCFYYKRARIHSNRRVQKIINELTENFNDEEIETWNDDELLNARNRIRRLSEKIDKELLSPKRNIANKGLSGPTSTFQVF